jgi:hypothetical protein
MAKVSGHHGLSLAMLGESPGSRRNPTEGSFAASAKSAQKSGGLFLLVPSEKPASVKAPPAAAQGGCVKEANESDERLAVVRGSAKGETISPAGADPAKDGNQDDDGGWEGQAGGVG